MTDIISTINSGIGMIPQVITQIRNLIIGLLSGLSLPTDSATLIIFGVISITLAFFWIKQFVIGSWLKISTILNFVLLSLLIYVSLVYVK